MNKKLICYFSATGTTKTVAEQISQIVAAKLFEIEPTEEYTTEDLDWTNKNSRSSLEMADENSRPSVKEKIENLDEYSTIIIGFPVWWYKEPTIIDTFIEENNLTDKQVYIFVTSGGSSEAESFANLKAKYPNIKFQSAKRFSTKVMENEVLEWLK